MDFVSMPALYVIWPPGAGVFRGMCVRQELGRAGDVLLFQVGAVSVVLLFTAINEANRYDSAEPTFVQIVKQVTRSFADIAKRLF